MSSPPPEGPPVWDAPTSDGNSGGHAPGPRSDTRLWWAVAGVAVLVVAATAAVLTRGGDGGETGGGGSATTTETTLPGNVGTMRGSDDTTPGNVGTVAPSDEDEDDDTPDGAGTTDEYGLPDVTIPAEAPVPTTIPGSEPNGWPIDFGTGEEAPQWGTLVVDLEEGGYEDFPVHLDASKELILLSLADDGIGTAIEVFAPDGTSAGGWRGGEDGVINGLEWFLPDDPLPATGTYVIRVVHTAGSHERFAIGFFGR